MEMSKLKKRVHMLPGWKAIQYTLINCDMEHSPLEIMTDSREESGDTIKVLLYTAPKGKSALGGIELKFTSTVQYRISYCSRSYSNFPTTLPPAENKMWRITLSKNTGIRLQIHCNKVKVLDLLLSEDTCLDSKWRNWHSYVSWIRFTRGDTASDFYRCRPKSGKF